VAAVVVGWNYRDDTAECIRSLLKSLYPALRVWYVDNGSTDGAPAFLREQFPSISVIELGANRGLVGGYNAGMDAALAGGADYICLCNNDVIVYPEAIEALVRYARVNPKIGIAAPQIVLHSDNRVIWSAGARWRRFPPGIVQRGMGARLGERFTTSRPIEYATSCVWLASAGLVREIGFFDPAYSFYYSDYEYCRRATLHGWELVYVPDAVIEHKVPLSTHKAPRPVNWWRNLGEAEARFHRQFVDLPTLLLHAVWIMARSVLQGNVRYVGAYLDGLRRGWRT
jgi:GT2 family glycosyltransferase